MGSKLNKTLIGTLVAIGLIACPQAFATNKSSWWSGIKLPEIKKTREQKNKEKKKKHEGETGSRVSDKDPLDLEELKFTNPIAYQNSLREAEDKL